jgi:pimeloyl-ACP methyl ester carboxylesterase
MPLDPPFSVTVHPYRAPVRGVVAYEMGASGSRNALVFVGGLTDGPHTSPFIRVVARHLEKASNLGYSVFEVRMRSSFTGFGTSSLANDVEDISALVKYLRSIGKEKIVLLGTSTGCQDCMEYADYTKHENLPVEGFILHAPVSDREALEMVFPDNQESIDLARSMIAEGKQDDCLPQDMVPSVLEAPISAYRFNSLCAKGCVNLHHERDSPVLTDFAGVMMIIFHPIWTMPWSPSSGAGSSSLCSSYTPQRMSLSPNTWTRLL